MDNTIDVVQEGRKYTIVVSKISLIQETEHKTLTYSWFQKHILGFEDSEYWVSTVRIGGVIEKFIFDTKDKSDSFINKLHYAVNYKEK